MDKDDECCLENTAWKKGGKKKGTGVWVAIFGKRWEKRERKYEKRSMLSRS